VGDRTANKSASKNLEALTSLTYVAGRDHAKGPPIAGKEIGVADKTGSHSHDILLEQWIVLLRRGSKQCTCNEMERKSSTNQCMASVHIVT
jgi:hypothetical protein